MPASWKKGRGKLGFMKPLIGKWQADGETQMGLVHCTRHFEFILKESYIRLEARWEFPAGAKPPEKCPDSAATGMKAYEELAIIGVGEGGEVGFWSFTSDGKRSVGTVADVTDIHPEAIGFEAQMPAGLARMIYWPDEEGGFYWAVESKTKKGWNRFMRHQYRAIVNL